MHRNNKKVFFVSVFISSLMIVGALSVRAEEETNIPEEPSEEQIASAGIVFPIKELGNCEDKKACKAYCDDPSNIESCIAFAEKKGLMKSEEAEKAKKFSKAIRDKNGPGQCDSPKACEAYCENLDHMDECMDFAKKQGVEGKHIESGRKMQEFLKKGGTTPGSCKSRGECEAYCSDFTHAEECLAFAEAAGIDHDINEESNNTAPLPREGIRKFIELSKKGETPGACQSKQACEAYCSSSDHFEECRAFGEKLGFSPPQMSGNGNQSRPAGPGGCDSAQSCSDFCSAPENIQTCLQFSKNHGLEKRIKSFSDVQERFEKGEFNEGRFFGGPEKENKGDRPNFPTNVPGAEECGRIAAEAKDENAREEIHRKVEECIRESLNSRAMQENQSNEKMKRDFPSFPKERQKNMEMEMRGRMFENQNRNLPPQFQQQKDFQMNDMMRDEKERMMREGERMPSEEEFQTNDMMRFEQEKRMMEERNMIPATGDFRDMQGNIPPSSGSFAPPANMTSEPTMMPSSFETMPSQPSSPSFEQQAPPAPSEPASWSSPSLLGTVLWPILELLSPRSTR